MSIAAIKITAQEMLGDDRYKMAELIHGEVVEKELSKIPSRIANKISRLIGRLVDSDKSGEIYGPDLGYQCFPDDPGGFRMPDVSFVRSDRLPQTSGDPSYMPIAPDLAVEVISPNDRARRIHAKTDEYLSIGVPLIWVVYPDKKQVVVYRADGSVTTLNAGDEITGYEVLPGFACRVAEFFE